jgi:hypothetical protein
MKSSEVLKVNLVRRQSFAIIHIHRFSPSLSGGTGGKEKKKDIMSD